MDFEFRLLVVDDEPMIVEMLCEYFRGCDINVDGFTSSHKALEAITNGNYAAGLFDISMPEMTGLQLLEKVRAKGISMPVVFLTALDDSASIKRALQLGAFDFVAKPFHLPNVLALVEKAMEVGRRERRVADPSTTVEQRTSDQKTIQKFKALKK